MALQHGRSQNSDIGGSPTLMLDKKKRILVSGIDVGFKKNY